MKILIISHFVPYPPHGGALQRNFNLLREIARYHEVHLVTLTQRVLLPDNQKLNASISALDKYCKVVKVFKRPTDYSKLRWYFLLLFNLFSLTPYSVWRNRSKEMAAEIRRQLRENRFDLIQVDTIDLVPYSRLASGVPRILNHQNVESSLLFRRAANMRNPLSRIYIFVQGWKVARYERTVCPQFDVNIAVSGLDRAELLKQVGPARVEVVPNGTDTEYFQPGHDSDSMDLIYAGGLTWYPNIDAMVYFCREVLPLIKERCPQVKMNIIGRYPPKEIQQLALDDKSVNLLGYVGDIREHIAKAAVYVVPLRVGGGTRLKILDAMAMGKAIVSTAIGAEGLDLTPARDIIIADGKSAFAEHVIDLLDSPEKRRSLGHNARETVVRRYSWNVIGPLLNEIYSDLAAEKARPISQ